ncbi:hypothetical protein Ciccas_003498 [Cichlidogyrus casuarinus]|uniref:SURP motif domain-containing protein n=1 Tax=Cichlidogyrus casuarinus TaxID=1844966 RepID=A0ABD2QF39_9PLAT
MIRFDCRGHLTTLDIDTIDLNLTRDEMHEEELCEYERYLELNTDLEENHTIEDTVPEAKLIEEEEDTSGPYVKPHELPLSGDVILPKTERQAKVIERTASFVAQQGLQMEIVLRTRQSGNPQFQFLEPDNQLNHFYREMTRLIKCGLYMPNLRPVSSSTSTEQVQTEMKLPKIDISDTSYAALINRFKPKPPEEKPLEKEKSQNDVNVDMYQDYYAHYYQFYHSQYALMSLSPEEVVKKATGDAAHAASALINAQKKASDLACKIDILRQDIPAEQVSVIDKTAEYVARNGAEFESILYKSKGQIASFSFLRPTDPAHAYYLAKKKAFLSEVESESSAKKNETEREKSPEKVTNLVPHYSESDSGEEVNLHPALSGVTESNAPINISFHRKFPPSVESGQLAEEKKTTKKPSGSDAESSDSSASRRRRRKKRKERERRKRYKKRRSSSSRDSDSEERRRRRRSRRERRRSRDTHRFSFTSAKRDSDERERIHRERRRKASVLLAKLQSSEEPTKLKNIDPDLVPSSVPAAVAALMIGKSVASCSNSPAEASPVRKMSPIEIMSQLEELESAASSSLKKRFRDKLQPDAYAQESPSSFSRKKRKMEKRDPTPDSDDSLEAYAQFSSSRVSSSAQTLVN